MAACRVLTSVYQRSLCSVGLRPRLTPCLSVQPSIRRQQISTGGNNVKVAVDDKTGVAVMTMGKPPVNSLNMEFLTEMAIALEKLENEKSCRGLILTSEVPTIFCAGLDILEMYQPQRARLSEFWRSLQEVWLKLYSSKLATVAAITGHSPAGGCLLATCCDYRIMAPGFKIGLNEVQLGIVAPFWFVDTMKNTIGHRHTEMALQLGKLYSTEEALAIGLVDKVLPVDQIIPDAHQELKQWLALPDHARQLSKLEMRNSAIERLMSSREADITNFVEFTTKPSIQAALGMYLEALKKKNK